MIHFLSDCKHVQLSVSCSGAHLGLLFSIMPFQHDDLLRRLVQVAGESFPLADEQRDLALQVLLPVVDHVNLQRVERA